MNLIYLLLGGNIGDRKSTLQMANQLIKDKIGGIIKQSKIYQTAAWGVTDQPSFLNQVIEVQSILTAKEILDNIHKIEAELGRKRLKKWYVRTIDIDILYFNNEVINTPDLKIPHPEIQNRKFALVPLCEIANSFNHPKIQLTNEVLLNNCEDKLKVELIS